MPTRSATLRREQAQSSTQPGETQPVETQQASKSSPHPNKHSMPPTVPARHKAEQDDQQQPTVSWIDKYLHDILSRITF